MYGLIFDMDGVLVDTEPLIAQATIEMFRDLYGVEVSHDVLLDYVGKGAIRYVMGPAEEYGIEVNLDAALAARLKNFDRLAHELGPELVLPGVLELIDIVRTERSWKLAIATSSPTDKFHVTMQTAGISLDLFDTYVTGDMVANRKPDPEIFLKAVQTLGLSKDACVVIEDSIAGVEAARTAGIPCIAVTNTFSSRELGAADIVVRSLLDINLNMLRVLVP